MKIILTIMMLVSSFLYGQTVNDSIKIIEFEGESVGVNNQICWLTSRNIEDTYFTIKSSEDGYVWKKIGEVKANGYDSYHFTDTSAYRYGTYYNLYLKSKRVGSIHVENLSSVFYTWIPTPKDGYIHISGTYEFEVYNSMGNLVSRGESNLVDVRDLHKGLYLLKIHSYTQKFYIK